MPDDFILQWGNPALHERARPVEVFDDLLRVQATRLARRLEAAGGAGLAATQVGSLRRLFAFRLNLADAIDVLVNPRVVWRSEQLELFVEGCLSLSSVAVEVWRPYAVRIAGYGVDGEERQLFCDGFGASLMQHEIDHLDGTLTLHRADPAERYRAVCELLASETDGVSAAV